MQGIVAFKEGRHHTLACHVLAPAHTNRLQIRHDGPPPKPWDNRNALWFPPADQATAVACMLRRHHASGMFVAPLGHPSHDALRTWPMDELPDTVFPVVRWSIKIEQQPHETLQGTYFCASSIPQYRQTGCHDLEETSAWTLQPIPYFDPQDPLPIMVPRHRAPQPPPDQAVPPSAIRPAAKHFKPALPVMKREAGDPPLPHQVLASRPSGHPYDVDQLEMMLKENEYPFPDVTQAVISNCRHGSGATVPPEDQSVYPNPPNSASLEAPPTKQRSEVDDSPAAPPLQDIVRQKLWESATTTPPTRAGPYPRPPFPNSACPHQAIVCPTSTTVKNEKWKALLQLLGDDAFALFMEAIPEPFKKEFGVGGKLRIVKNASWPHKSSFSLNARQRGIRLAMLYATPREIKIALAALPGCRALTFDVSAAYNTLSLSADELWAFVIKIATEEFGVEYFVDIVNPFGTLDAEAGWQGLMAIFTWVLRFTPAHKLFRIGLHYVDNEFLFVRKALLGDNPDKELQRAQQQLFAFLRRLGVPFHECEAGTTFGGLGFNWTTEPSTVSLKAGKHILATHLLTLLCDNEPSPRNAYDSTLSLLQWMATYLPLLKPLVNAVRVELLPLNRRPEYLITASSTMQDHLQLLAIALEAVVSGLPCKISSHDIPDYPPDILCRTDASTSVGCGGINFATFEYVSHVWTEEEIRDGQRALRLSSTHMEALGALFIICHFLVPGCLLELEVDSKPLADAWTSGRGSHPLTNKVLCHIRLYAASIGATVRMRHIPRDYNQVSDALSEQKRARPTPQELAACLPSPHHRFSPPPRTRAPPYPRATTRPTPPPLLTPPHSPTQTFQLRLQKEIGTQAALKFKRVNSPPRTLPSLELLLERFKQA